MVILHGLYGSSDNWLTVCKSLEKHFEIYIPDQRNHGRSPHSEEINYELLSEDLVEFLNKHRLDNIILMGHSMGGKVAMHFARKHPERITHLILVDIAPKNYYPDENKESLVHINILESLKKLYLPAIKTRNDAEELLAVDLPDKRLRSFLLKNLKRNPKGGYDWLLNLDSIQKNFTEISEGFSLSEWNNTTISGFPVLFVKGGKSNYIENNDLPFIRQVFPASDIVELSETGHWLHAEKPVEFANIVMDFISG